MELGVFNNNHTICLFCTDFPKQHTKITLGLSVFSCVYWWFSWDDVLVTGHTVIADGYYRWFSWAIGLPN